MAALLALVATAASRMTCPTGVRRAAAPATPRAAPTKLSPPVPKATWEFRRSFVSRLEATSLRVGMTKDSCNTIRV
jgi:hypothetical protein